MREQAYIKIIKGDAVTPVRPQPSISSLLPLPPSFSAGLPPNFCHPDPPSFLPTQLKKAVEEAAKAARIAAEQEA